MSPTRRRQTIAHVRAQLPQVSERRTCRVLGEENLEAKKESGDDVAGQLLEATEPTAGLLEHDFISESYGLWSPGRDSLHEATGLQIGVAYTTLLQLATGRPDDRDAWSGDFDLFVQWTLLPGEADAGSLGFLVEERHRLFTNITPNALGENVGAALAFPRVSYQDGC